MNRKKRQQPVAREQPVKREKHTNSSSDSTDEEQSSSSLFPPARVSKYFARNTRGQADQKEDELVKQEEKLKRNFESVIESPLSKKTKSKKAKGTLKDIEDYRDIDTEEENENPECDGKGGLFVYKDKKYQLDWMPKNFQLAWDNIEAMREAEPAPVDTMGCSKCHDSEADEKLQRFQSLVALMMSSQTRDETNYAAMDRLKKNGLSVQYLLDVDEQMLADLIKPVSFHNTKAKNLKKVGRILRAQYEDDIPDTVEGVGPKMAHLTMKCAWNELTGIAVDTHVHRIVNRLRWVRKETKTPEQTMKSLEEWLPKPLWFDINENLVGFGQTVCSSKKPKCGSCLNRPICSYALKNGLK